MTFRDFRDYNKVLIDGIPHDLYVIALVVFCAGTVMALGLKGWKGGWRKVIGLLLVEYVALIYCSTVFCRKVSERVGHDFSPFWSYFSYFRGEDDGLLVENIMNVVVFIPVGILLGCGFRQMKWWKVLLIGGGISISIETMQYFFKRGFAEVDDMMHNTLGCVIGYLLVQGAWFMVRGFRRRRIAG